MRVGEISVPVHCPPSHATYGACAIGNVAPPDAACAGAAATALTRMARISFTRMTVSLGCALGLSALNFAPGHPELSAS